MYTLIFLCIYIFFLKGRYLFKRNTSLTGNFSNWKTATKKKKGGDFQLNYGMLDVVLGAIRQGLNLNCICLCGKTKQNNNLSISLFTVIRAASVKSQNAVGFLEV